MFVGHYGVGFAAKAAARKPSLGSCFLAAQLPDLLWPTLVLLGVERVAIKPGITAVAPLEFVHDPFSHSLASTVLWGALVGVIYFVLRRDRRGALLLGGAVVSHWVLDAIVHPPDLPLTPGGETVVGAGLWFSVWATLVFELGILALGVWLYLRATRPVGRAGVAGLWVLVGLLGLLYAGNILSPPPPSVRAVAWTGECQWLFVLWGYWLDRRRVPARAGLVRATAPR